MTRKQNNRALTHISLVMTLNFRFCTRCRQVKDISEFFCASKTREPLQELHINEEHKKTRQYCQSCAENKKRQRKSLDLHSSEAIDKRQKKLDKRKPQIHDCVS